MKTAIASAVPAPKIVVELQDTTAGELTPEAKLITAWVEHASIKQLAANNCYELTVRVVSEEEISQLNESYRDKQGATNVLSFPFDTPDVVAAETEYRLLGDLVICATVIQQQATEQHKSLQSHWAHIVIHGFLHLLGYDHQTNTQANEMEDLEIELLRSLGIQNPYLTEEQQHYER